MEKQGKSPRIRIAWKAGKHKSYGKWQAPSCREWMQGVIERFDRDYGPGTHWIEEEKLPKRKKPRVCKLSWGRWEIWGSPYVPKLQFYDLEELYKAWKTCLRIRAPAEVWRLYFPEERQ